PPSTGRRLARRKVERPSRRSRPQACARHAEPRRQRPIISQSIAEGPSMAAKPAAPAIKKSSARKVMITCAVTGAIHTPSMSPHLPVTPEEIAEAAIGAHEAGAALVHVHARDPKTGKPDQSPE